MRYILLTILFSVSIHVHSANVKKWTDAAGNVHYGSIAPKGAPADIVQIPTAAQPSASAVLERRLTEIKNLTEEHDQRRSFLQKQIERKTSQRFQAFKINRATRQHKREHDYNNRMCALHNRWISDYEDRLRAGYTISQRNRYERQIRKYKQDKRQYCP